MRARGTVFLLSLSAAVGCANVIGAGDYQVAATGGGGPVAGTGGSRPPDAGTGGRGGAAGAGGAGIGGAGVGGAGVGGAGASGAGGGPGSASGDSICGVASCPTGLDCQFLPALGSSTGVCVLPCASGTCDSGHLCLPVLGTSGGCLRDCTTVACATGLSCMNFGDTTSPIWTCVPTDWLSSVKTGLGDACMTSAECASGQCTGDGTIAGYCTEPCSDTSATCSGGHGSTGWENSYGEFNWCVKDTAGAFMCTPGCDVNASSCNKYPGTTCATATTVFAPDTASVCMRN